MNPCFLLDNVTDRRKYMEQLFAQNNIKNVRISAILLQIKS